jgi:DNA-binding NarL/FixJ family response regulator
VNTEPEPHKAAKGLIADDDARMRQIIRALILDLALEIFEAADGRTALDTYLLHNPDWVTLDLDMVPVDGLIALRGIKTHDPLARIVIVTAHDTKAFREAAAQGGAIGYVLKDDLSKIREVLITSFASRKPDRLSANTINKQQNKPKPNL